MFERSLFERLLDEKQTPPSATIDGARAVSSVMDHLQRLFNARTGAVPIREDYGMPDFNDLVAQFPAAIPAISRAIKTQIDLFEPRLHRVIVRHVPDPDRPLSLFFAITAELDLPEGSERVSFETIFGADGSVRLR